MKTIEQQLKDSWGFSDEDLKKLKYSLAKDNLIDIQNITNLAIDYAEEAIKADRENLLNYVTASIYRSENDERMDDAVVDEDSIINAPNIILE